MSVLGFDFIQGPEVPAPQVIDHTLPPLRVENLRVDWAEAIHQAVRDHDAWGVLVVKPDCDVELFDVSNNSMIYRATGYAHTAHLLLAREA